MWSKSFRVTVCSHGRIRAEEGSHVLACASFFSPLLGVRQNNRSHAYLSETILLQLREDTFSFIKIIILVESMISHNKSILLLFFLAGSLICATSQLFK